MLLNGGRRIPGRDGIVGPGGVLRRIPCPLGLPEILTVAHMAKIRITPCLHEARSLKYSINKQALATLLSSILQGPK